MTRAITFFTLLLLFTSTAFGAIFTVTKIADTNDGTCDADCSLREAIAVANTTPTPDINSIVFSSLFSSPQTITLSGTEMVISGSGALVISGPGANLLTLDGNQASRIMTVGPGAQAVIVGIKFTRGNGAGALNTGRGGAIYNSGGTATYSNLVITGNTAANGGGTNHANTATTTYINCVISGNSATGAGGGTQNFGGSILTMINSTVSGNTSNSTLTGGGAIQANGTLTFTNVTFAVNNASGGEGGAIYYNGQGLTMTNVTISGNTSTGGGGGIHKSTSTLNAFLRNNIIAGNNGTAASRDLTGVFSSNGNNIIGNVGTSSGWVPADLQNMNPLLGPFGDNGGFGNTFLPMMPGSPAINAGQNCVVDLSCGSNNPPIAVTTDQRGVARPQGGTVDIGSVEVAAAAAPATVSGRIFSSAGSSVSRAFVTISNKGGAVASDMTNSFGYFVLSGVPSGQTYTVTVQAKGYTFAPVNVPVAGDVSGLAITSSSSPLQWFKR